MPIIKHNALVPYSAQQMFDLVNDIEAYPQFLPWCKSTHVQERTAMQVIASMEVSKGVINKTFTTHNTLNPPAGMTIELVNGPFEHLIGRWEFIALNPQACRVNFVLDFAFKNSLTSLIAQPVLSYIADSIVDAFIKRAAAQGVYEH